MAFLIDTSIFVALERRGQMIASLAAILPDEPAAIASITASELLAGVYRANSPQRRTKREAFVEALLDVFPTIPFDLRSARIHAQVWADLAAAGQLVGAHDLLIAATALAHGYTVITENLRDFQRVPGLSVRQPAW